MFQAWPTLLRQDIVWLPLISPLARACASTICHPAGARLRALGSKDSEGTV